MTRRKPRPQPAPADLRRIPPMGAIQNPLYVRRPRKKTTWEKIAGWLDRIVSYWP